MTQPHDERHLHIFILNQLLALRDRVTVLETKISPTSSSQMTWWKEMVGLASMVVGLAKRIPWGLVAFGLMSLWQVIVPAVRRLLPWLGLG